MPHQTSLFSPASGDGEATDAPLPPGWRRRTLADLVRRGRPITYGIVQPGDHDPDGVYLVRGGDYSSGWAEPDELFRVSPKIEGKYGRSRLEPGDLVMTIVGANTGTVAVVPDWLDGANITQTTARISLDPEEADRDYVRSLLSSSIGQRLVYTYQKGGAQPGLNLADVRIFEIPLPPLSEQRAVAAVLRDWDAAVATLDGLADAYADRLHGLRQQLLDHRRSPERDAAGWRHRPLSDFFRRFRTRNGADDTPRPVLSCSKVYGIILQSERFDNAMSSSDTSRYKVVEEGDLVYDPMLLWDGSIGFVSSDTGVVSPAYETFRLRSEHADQSFLAHLFKAYWMRHQYTVISRGTNARRRKATWDDFLDIEVYAPDLDEQREVSSVLDAAQEALATARRQRKALARQRRGLAERLLVGDVQVPDAPRPA